MNEEDYKKEVLYIFKSSCILNVIVYLPTLIFKANIDMLLGLILGTIILFINLNLLKHDINSVVNLGGNKKSLYLGYVLRYLLIASAFYFTAHVEIINPIGVILPQFYPKIAYTIKAIVENKKERSC